MGINDYLADLLANGVASGHFILLPINRLDKSCCLAAKTEVIDFDAVKEKIRDEKGTHNLKSCDALKIIPTHGRIDFIEMKGLKQLVKWSRHKQDVVNLDIEVREKVLNFNLLGKIVDSLRLLDFITTLRDFPFNDETRKHYLDVEKYFVVLIDIDPAENAIEFIALNLQFWASFSTNIEHQIERYFAAELSRIPVNIAPNFQHPILKHCGEIDQYYASL